MAPRAQTTHKPGEQGRQSRGSMDVDPPEVLARASDMGDPGLAIVAKDADGHNAGWHSSDNGESDNDDEGAEEEETEEAPDPSGDEGPQPQGNQDKQADKARPHQRTTAILRCGVCKRTSKDPGICAFTLAATPWLWSRRCLRLCCARHLFGIIGGSRHSHVTCVMYQSLAPPVRMVHGGRGSEIRVAGV